MTEAKSNTGKVGDVVKAKSVTRPDGTEQTVSYGTYVLDVAGLFVIDGEEISAK